MDCWDYDIHHLSHMAESQPQAAYAALTKSLQREWIFLQRVVPMCCTLFANLETTLLASFFPAMFGCEISSLEQRMFSLPVRFGGLGVDLPVTSADSMYAASRHATGILMDAIIAGSSLEPCVHEDLILVAQRHHRKQLNTRYDALFSTLAWSWILFAVVLFSILVIKTSGSESRGQEEAASMRIFKPMRLLQ